MANAWVLPQAFNMAGITLFEDDIPYIQTGDYEVALVETDEWKGKKGQVVTSIIFRNRIVEAGSELGKPVAVWCGVNPSPDGGTARQWKSALISFGYDAKGMETTMRPEVGWFKIGAHAFVHVESPPRVEGQKIEAEDVKTTYISPETYRKRKAERALAGTGTAPPPAAAPGFTPNSPPPGLPAAPTTVAHTAAPQPPAQAGGTLFGQPPQAPAVAPNGAPPAGGPPPMTGSAPPPMA